MKSLNVSQASSTKLASISAKSSSHSVNLSLTSFPPSTIAKKRPPKSTKSRTEVCHIPNPVSSRSRTARPSTNDPNTGSFNSSQIKSSVKENGYVKGYAAATDQGTVRNYNEDRVSIIFNIKKPRDRDNETWPKCSFFGVYDGHGGSTCADFLRDNLHQFVTRSRHFPCCPKEALEEGFALAESTFSDFAKSLDPIETSGSCAIVVLVVDDMCYVANLGDSRAVMSEDGKVIPLSKDHKPEEQMERERIKSAGGMIYQNSQDQKGPFRIFPGGLSMSRGFGDIRAKYREYGGNPDVLIAVPDIKSFKLQSELEFIVLASDGIYDKLSNREVVNSVFEELERRPFSDVHKMCEVGVEAIMMTALMNKTMDNITAVVVGFEGLEKKSNDFGSVKLK